MEDTHPLHMLYHGADACTCCSSVTMQPHGVVQGSTPSAQKTLELYQVLSKSDTNLRQPIELENQLLKHMTMDSEVGQSMLQLLQVTHQSACYHL